MSYTSSIPIRLNPIVDQITLQMWLAELDNIVENKTIGRITKPRISRIAYIAHCNLKLTVLSVFNAQVQSQIKCLKE